MNGTRKEEIDFVGEVYSKWRYTYGGMEKSKKVLNTINPKECTVLGFIDNAPDKKGKVFENKTIFSPDEICSDYQLESIVNVRFHNIGYEIVYKIKIDTNILKLEINKR